MEAYVEERQELMEIYNSLTPAARAQLLTHARTAARIQDTEEVHNAPTKEGGDQS